jgi:hypothetical protein
VENIITVYEYGTSHHGVFLNAGAFPGDLNSSAKRIIHHAMSAIMKESLHGRTDEFFLSIRPSG